MQQQQQQQQQELPFSREISTKRLRTAGKLDRFSKNMCQGWWRETHSYRHRKSGNVVSTVTHVRTKLLAYSSSRGDVLDGCPWYAEPKRRFEIRRDQGAISGTGVLRAHECLGQSHDGMALLNNMCDNCRKIPDQSEDQTAYDVIHSSADPEQRVGASSVKRENYSNAEWKQQNEKMGEQVHKQEKEIKVLHQELKTMKVFSLRPWSEQLKEASERCDVGMMMYELAQAHETGVLAKQPALFLAQVKDQIHNCLAKSSKGWRHDEERVKTFYEVLCITGKKSVFEFAAMNQMGPGLTTIRNRIREIPKIKFGVNESLFEYYAGVFKKMMLAKDIPLGSVLCEHSEDETSTVKEIEYVQATGELLGF
jgi:hypothetical protein